MAFFDRNRNSHPVEKAEDGERHPDGKFKMGPANAQRKMGDTAFQAAKDHIDHAAGAAKNGDEQAADFHVGMAQQYAALGAKNHLMGKYVDDTKGKTPMPMLAQAQPTRKTEEELLANSPIRKDGSFRNGDGGGADAGASKLGYAPSPGYHMMNIASNHMAMADAHSNAANALRSVGQSEDAAMHQGIANEHKAAATHYQAAGDAHIADDKDALAKHLKAARAAVTDAQAKAQTASGAGAAD